MKKIGKTYAFIDASNLFYGGEKSLGWKIDYQKLIKYLKKKYKVSKVFYYGGVELDGFTYSLLENKPIDLRGLESYLRNKQKAKTTSESEVIILDKHMKRVKFYQKLDEFGYNLKLKPVKVFKDDEGNTTKKANCDVDMTFDLMLHSPKYSGAVVLSGDGDFVVVLKYLKKIGKEVVVMAREERTAKEIKLFAGGNFRDFNYLKEILKYVGRK
jgi:uncharacterized LabA/DUF88 family protein